MLNLTNEKDKPIDMLLKLFSTKGLLKIQQKGIF